MMILVFRLGTLTVIGLLGLESHQGSDFIGPLGSRVRTGIGFDVLIGPLGSELAGLSSCFWYTESRVQGEMSCSETKQKILI